MRYPGDRQTNRGSNITSSRKYSLLERDRLKDRQSDGERRKKVIQMRLAVARPRGAMGGGQHLPDLFCNSSKYDKNLVGGEGY